MITNEPLTSATFASANIIKFVNESAYTTTVIGSAPNITVCSSAPLSLGLTRTCLSAVP